MLWVFSCETWEILIFVPAGELLFTWTSFQALHTCQACATQGWVTLFFSVISDSINWILIRWHQPFVEFQAVQILVYKLKHFCNREITGKISKRSLDIVTFFSLSINIPGKYLKLFWDISFHTLSAHFFPHGATAPIVPRASSLSRHHDHTKLFTPHSVGHLWTSDQPVAETSAWPNTRFTRDRHPCPRGIRTRNPSKRAPADPSLRQHGNWDRLAVHYSLILLPPIGM
jgi:hypothetical protein